MLGFNIPSPVNVTKYIWGTPSQVQSSSRDPSSKSRPTIRITEDDDDLNQIPMITRGTIEKRADLSAVQEEGLLQLMKEVSTLEEYLACAERLDVIQGHNEWKLQRESSEPEYDPNIIEEYIRRLENARMAWDVPAMQHLLRTSLSRDLGGMNLLRLYKHSWVGTKVLIEDYIACVLRTIQQFTEASTAFNLANDDVQISLQALEEALKSFGRSALTLSGGGTQGMKHIGVIKTLWEADLLPEIISGASAGSIVAAVIGVASDDEIWSVLQNFPYSDLACFDPAGTGSFGWARERILNYLYQGTFFHMRNMERVMKGWIGNITFREAYNKTHRVLNICVSSAESDEPRLLNYLTAPNVLVWSAVCASCSVPTVFPSANVYEKDPETREQRIWMAHAKQMFVDGSLDHDIPMRKLSEMFNVNFFIVSQVNPHVRVFLQAEEILHNNEPPRVSPSWLAPQHIASKLFNMMGRETLHFAQQLRNLGLDFSQLRWASLLSQQYTGDINIFPAITIKEILTLVSNPTPQFMVNAAKDGERATWQEVHRVKNCVAIELGLIRAIHTLKEHISFGPQAKAAREVSRHSGHGRSFSITGQRPGALQGRSFSSETVAMRKHSNELAVSDSTVSLVSMCGIRRHQSVGALDNGTTSSIFSSVLATPVTSPGLSPGFAVFGAMSISSVVSRDENPYFKNLALDGYY